VNAMSEETEGQARIVTASAPNYSFAKFSFVAGMTLLIANNLFYFFTRAEFFSISAPSSYSLTSAGLLVAGSILVSLAIFSFLSISRKAPLVSPNGKSMAFPLRKVVGDVLFGGRNVVILSAVVYGLIFAFLDGIMIFQPGVDFYSAYGVNGNTLTGLACCGPTGSVPVLLVFLPGGHLGVQLAPTPALIMVLVSSMVGLNVALLYTAVKKSCAQLIDGKKGTFGGILGAGFGLFAGCPTCAAAFFLSLLAGSGATVVSAFIARYQPLILGLTVPLLLASVVWQSRSIGRMSLGCAL
jgi:hypothetical protein